MVLYGGVVMPRRVILIWLYRLFAVWGVSTEKYFPEVSEQLPNDLLINNGTITYIFFSA